MNDEEGSVRLVRIWKPREMDDRDLPRPLPAGTRM